MIEIVKSKICNLLENKAVSLAMIYERSGRILWHKGRKISGKTIFNGHGFCRDEIQETLHSHQRFHKENATVSFQKTGNNQNTYMGEMEVKTLILQPLNSHFFLYIDSGVHETFSTSELAALETSGEILAEMIARLREENHNRNKLAGHSQKMNHIRELILAYSMEEEPVLLLGETGVGKNHTAELLHHNSGRKGKFVVAGAPNLQENLFESTLFGHKKGAFTDAKFDKTGLVEEARGGTLLIDEISEVPLSLQAKLLRFIESQKYRILGESNERLADVRIIAASNKNLLEAIEKNQFREDLYYRLNVLEIDIPPLRERPEDIADFIQAQENVLKGKTLENDVMEALLEHDWPGNYRELSTVLKRAGICVPDPIQGDAIREIIKQTTRRGNNSQKQENVTHIWNKVKSGHSFWNAVKKPYLNRDINRTQAKNIISKALAEVGGQYKACLKIFNLQPNEYGNFMRFLYDNRLK